VLVVALLFSPFAHAQNAAAPAISEAPVEGTNVRRMQATTTIRAPFEVVSRRLLDFARYPEILRRVRTARVVRRDRAQTDVYFQLELPRAMGTIWFLHRMTTLRPSPNRLEIRGVAQSGNVGRVETQVTVERITPTTTRFTFALFGLPVVPALPDTINGALRDAVRATATLLQQRAEQEASVNPR
jgi:Polyketide cyclase / dehydrase and lipid transport